MSAAAATVKALVGAELNIMIKDIPVELVLKGVQGFNRALFIRYFKGYRIQVAERKRVKDMVEREILGKEDSELAQVLMTLWNRANGRLYHAVYNKVRSINEEVDKIERIEDEKAGPFLDDLMKDFDADRLYLCILFNEVRFSREIVEQKLGKKIPLDPWPPKPQPEEPVPGTAPAAEAAPTAEAAPAADAEKA